MAITIYRGERSVSEIADKLFSKLTALQREKVESALLKANPQLSNIRKLPKGAILRVPDLPELRAKINRRLENPDDQIVKQLMEALDAFSQHMRRQVDSERKSVKQQAVLLKNAKFKKDISNSDKLQALAAEANKALRARSKNIVERQKKVDESIRRAVKDLDAGLF